MLPPSTSGTKRIIVCCSSTMGPAVGGTRGEARPGSGILAAELRLGRCLAFSLQLDRQVRPGLLAFGNVRAREYEADRGEDR